MLVPELKSSQRHLPSLKELGETEVKSSKKRKSSVFVIVIIDGSCSG